MNSIDQHREPALDSHADAQQDSHRRSNRHTRHVSSATNEQYPPIRPPPAPEVPSAPPISYPGTTQPEGVGLQRSFSQRARARPFAEEAFADDDLGDPIGHEPPRTAPQAQSRPMSDQPVRSQPNTKDDEDRRRRIIQDNIQTAAHSAYSSREPFDQTAADLKGHYAKADSMGGVSRVPTVKEPALQPEQREWAPDRSPLQKLEVTLGSISKEEKRARVQEAEMLHMQKTRGRGAMDSVGARSSRNSQPLSQNPTTIEDLGVVRGLSTTQKDRLQHSTTVDSHKPDVRNISGERKGFEYQVIAPPARSVTITRRKGPTTVYVSRPDLGTQRSVSSSQAPTRLEPSPQFAPSRSVSAAQPTTQLPQRIPQRQLRDPDPIPTAQERNASHRAALEQLTGSGTAAGQKGSLGKGRSNTDRGQSVRQPPATTTGRSAPATHDLVTLQRAPAARSSTPPSQSIPTGLGVQQSPGVRSIDSAAPTAPTGPAVELGQRHKRQSSVSFKDPYDKRRPTDEWKSAELAQLSAPDFVLRPVEKTDNAERDKAWWEQDAQARKRNSRSKPTTTAMVDAIDDRIAEFKPRLLVKCGPLLRYTGMKRTVGEGAKEYWRGTVMLVTQDSQSSYEKPPVLRLFAQSKSLLTRPVSVVEGEQLAPEHVDPLAGTIKMSRIGRALYVRPVEHLPEAKDLSQIETDDGLFESSPPVSNSDGNSVSVVPPVSRLSDLSGESCGKFKEVSGVRLYADPDRDVTFWLFKLEIQLGPQQQHIGYRINRGVAQGFWVPAAGQTMNIMFHSCNGFSMSVKPDEFSGPDPLWRDVLNVHQSKPFHVMIGGGDQIYNDKVMNSTHHFGEWSLNKNPHYKHHAPFTSEMKEELETFYLENYCKWFSQGLFSMANAQIPMVNMWDDHDIIDGFGSYPHPFMLSPVFSGVGAVAFKYYMLSQQQSVENMTTADEPSWILGYKPGPYIKQLSRSILLDLGQSVAFLALDCRTERMKNQVLSVDTCDLALERCRKEIVEDKTKHLIVLLGVPIAYPRMNWLENVLTSRVMDPVKAMGRYGLLKGGVLNRFDGGVEVLDDLDDHWTAHNHKEERNEFIKELQDLAAERSVRITILGGDVHLAAIGQFYSNPKLKIPKDRDHRYMPNVVSSAIVNTPPPEMLADVLNKRNKVHHLDSYTDESMIPMFTHDVNLKKRNNKHLLPRRNWCSISAYIPGQTPPTSRSPSPESVDREDDIENRPQPKRRFSLSRDDVNPRMLMRRLSSRNAPPTAYKEGGMYEGEDSRRAASFDGADQPRSRSWNQRLGLGRRTSSETRHSTRDTSAKEDEDADGYQPPPFRPGFHRRPTNLSEKAAKKGNVPAVDAEGNEIDVNDHVNLDGGLDIILNCEVDQRDPSGITEPYRLLVPSLWYDGSSDREKLDGATGLSRKPTLLNRMGFGGQRGNKAKDQNGEDWADDVSNSEDYNSEEENEARPKKKFGLFSSLRRKRPEQDSEYAYDEETGNTDQTPMGIATNMGNAPAPGARAAAEANHSNVRSGGLYGNLTGAGVKPVGQDAYEGSHEFSAAQGSNIPVNQGGERDQQMRESAPSRWPSFKAKNLLRKNSDRQSARGPMEVPYLNYSNEPRRSYTSETRGATLPAGNDGRPGTSSAHAGAHSTEPVHANHTNTGRSASQPLTNVPSGPPSSFRTGNPEQSASISQRTSSARSSNSGNIQGENYAAPGLATDRDAFSNNPQQRSLRGNGILGKNRATSGPSPNVSNQEKSQDYFASQGPGRTTSQGYDGFEGDRPKPKRGLSLRDRARGFIDRVEGRRRYDDEDNYSGDEGQYSDELGEEGEGVHSDREGSFIEGDDNEYSGKPKRGFSQRFKAGMAKIGPKREQQQQQQQHYQTDDRDGNGKFY